MSKQTVEGLFEDLRDQYFNQHCEPATFLGNVPVKEGMTYWMAHQLYMMLMNDLEGYDFFAVMPDYDDKDNVTLLNMLTTKTKSVPSETFYPKRGRKSTKADANYVYVLQYHLCTPGNTTPDAYWVYTSHKDAVNALKKTWEEIQEEIDVTIYDVQETKDRIKIYDYDGTDLLLKITKEKIR